MGPDDPVRVSPTLFRPNQNDLPGHPQSTPPDPPRQTYSAQAGTKPTHPASPNLPSDYALLPKPKSTTLSRPDRSRHSQPILPNLNDKPAQSDPLPSKRQTFVHEIQNVSEAKTFGSDREN